MLLHHVQPSFAGGEISPSLQARADSVAYYSWVKSARNFYVHPQGGASNRPGTAYMGMAKYTDTTCRIIPFAVGEEEAYVLEFGKGYIRFYTSAGQVLDSENHPYEIATPYQEEDLAGITYVQYDQTLFLAHSAHAPRRLVRVEAGEFRLEELPVLYGPFQLANTKTANRMRIIPFQESQETSGVAATLSFQPVVDNRYFVYGYFNDTLFFAARGYGLDMELLVSEFNRINASQGVNAVNLGGLLKITSPQATGGDWNGVTLRLEYRDSLLHDPSLIIEQPLSGGANSGETINTGNVSYLLESNVDIFTPQHVGTLFSVTHVIESQYKKGSLGYDSSSQTIKSGFDWSIRTSGTWTGTLILEKSEDLGNSWQAVKHFVRGNGDDNVVDVGTLDDKGEIYLLRLRADGITGEAGYELAAASFMQEGIARVEAFISARKAAVSLAHGVGSNEWTSDWAEGSFGHKSGYPGSIFFYQDRLGFAGTQAEPQTIWFSKTGEYENFGHARGTLEDTDAISINLSGKKLNAVQSVAVAGKLLVFTAGSEWTISCSGALTPYNIQVEQQGERGACRVPSVMVGNRALYVQARASALRDFCYDYNTSSYTGNDLTLCAKHLFSNKMIREMCYQQEPDNLVWCILSDGTAATLTYVPEQEICAWTHHDTQGYFRSVCTIPNRGYDEVWFVVQRSGKYFIEKLLQRLISKEPQEQVFLDASISKKSADSFTQVEGLNYLEGQKVGVLGDGYVLTEMTVTNGKITLPQAMHNVHVGLTYTAQLQTLPVVFQAENGLGLDRKKRIVSVTLKVADSRGGMIAFEGEPSEEIIQRNIEPYNTPISLRTESYVIPLSGKHTLTPSLIVSQADPLPITLLAILSRVA